jgi:glycosyltransferase involved in cell wall biosynthesis
MRVCLVCATFPPETCGVGDYTFQLARALGEAGIEVSVVTSDRGLPEEANQAPAGVIVQRPVASWSLRQLPALVRTLRAGHYDLVHVQYTPNLYGRRTLAINLMPCLAARILHTPTLVTFMEFYTPLSHGLRELLAGVYDRVKDTLLLWSSTGVIVTVPNRARQVSRLFPWLRRRVHVLPSGANLELGQTVPEERERGRAHFGIGSTELVIGSFGSLHTDKRYELLLRVVRSLLDRGHRIRLLLIGAYSDDHPYFRYLTQRVSDLELGSRVIWTGFGTPAEVSRWLLATDVYVMTDVRGASARKSSLITALAHGLPTVSTRGVDTECEFIDGKGIVLVDTSDEEENLLHHLDRLLKDPEERSRLALGARQLHQSHFSWQGIARRAMDVYRQYLPHGR